MRSWIALAVVALLAGCTCSASNMFYEATGRYHQPGYMAHLPGNATGTVVIDGHERAVEYEDRPVDERYRGAVDAEGFLGVGSDEYGLVRLGYADGSDWISYSWHDGRVLLRAYGERDDAHARKVATHFFEGLGWSHEAVQEAVADVMADPYRRPSDEPIWDYRASPAIESADALFQEHVAQGMQWHPTSEYGASRGPWTWHFTVAMRIVEVDGMRIRAAADGQVVVLDDGRGQAPSQQEFEQRVAATLGTLGLPALGTPREFDSSDFCSW